MNAGPALAAPAALEHLNPDAVSPLLLVCDHASRALPPAYGNLGIGDAELARHIGWDIGAAALTRRLAVDLKAPAVLAPWSRLLIDLNRAPDDPTSICAVSDGTVIPANRGIGEEERARRVAQLHRPYHAGIAAEMDRGCSAACRHPP
jgi:predicted N-formylglutamate amidohydrolase